MEAKDDNQINSIKTVSKKNNSKKQENETFVVFEDKEYFNKLTKIEEKLKNYIIENYDIDNEKISLKYIHTFKTKLVTDKITTSLNLTDRQKYLASIIALFHDYARFEQVKQFDSFNDLTTLDHADLAVSMLFEKNEINNFVSDLTEEELEIVKLAIKNHNKYEIEKGLNDAQEMFCKIIRDADKVDIFRVISTNFKLDKQEIGFLQQEDLDSFYSHKLYRKKAKQTFYTHILSSISFIYDIYFKISYELLKENNYINKYMCAILLSVNFKVDDRLLDCFKYAENFINAQLELDDNNKN